MAKGSKASKKDSKKGSPDKKSKKVSPGKQEVVVAPPVVEIPSRVLDLQKNEALCNTPLLWLEGPGFTIIINRCYTKDEPEIFRGFLELQVWDPLTLEADSDQFCRECIHGNCKDWPGTARNSEGLPDFKSSIEKYFTQQLPLWDCLYVPPNAHNEECCLHRGGTSLRTVNLASVPDGPKYVNTFNIQSQNPKIIKSIPNQSIAYAYLRDLGLQGPYDFAVHKEIQKSYMNVKNVPCVSETLIKRSLNNVKLGLVLSIIPGPKVFVLFVIKNSPAYRADIHYGDEIHEIDGLSLNTHLALRRLTENKSLVINALYTKCPFKFYYCIEILKGESMGFQIVDGNIIFVNENSPAYIAKLPLNHQIIELERECIVGLSNLELQRAIRNRACDSPGRLVNMTLVPRFIYNSLTGSMDPKYIRKRALCTLPNKGDINIC